MKSCGLFGRGVRAAAALLAALLAGQAVAADYVSLPGGSFQSVLAQGATPAETAPVRVAAFAMRATPVASGEFRAFLLRHPEWQRGRVPSLYADSSYLSDWQAPASPAADTDPLQPVTRVSWFAARAFCESEQARLPSWIEWEYAAAADETRTDARGDPAWRARILAWYERPASSAPPRVGGPPNVYGIRDLHGSIWEWVEDFNALFIAGDSRTQGDPDTFKFCGAGAINVVGRDSYAVLMRIALLSSLGAADTTRSLGFRCARDLPGEHR